MKVKSIFKKSMVLATLMLIAALSLAACGDKEPHMGRSGPLPVSDSSKEDTDTADNIRIVQELNMLEETITVYDVVSRHVMRYKYSLATQFLDKYGVESSALNFTPGTAVVLGDKLKSNALSYIRMSDKTWTESGITRYKIDADTHKMTIGSATYRFTDDICVYAGYETIALQSVGESDTLTVVGKDNNILSIAVTTGHGYIQFVNTQGFDGSMVQIGRKIFTKVTPDMLTEVPEGSYDVTVANAGLGDTIRCDVTRGEITVIDLSQVAREGDKSCKLTFVASTPDISVYLDGNQVNVNSELDIPYGVHIIRVSAPGYNDWSKTLYVNSPSAKIAIDMSDGSSSSNKSSTSTSNTTKNSTSNSTKRGNSTALSTSDIDYLSTISNMISTLTGT